MVAASACHFDDAATDLGRPNKSSEGHGRCQADPLCLEQRQQVDADDRADGASDDHDPGEKPERTALRRKQLSCWTTASNLRPKKLRWSLRKGHKDDREGDQELDGCVREAGASPSKMSDEVGRQWPAHGAGETTPQRQHRDR